MGTLTEEETLPYNASVKLVVTVGVVVEESTIKYDNLSYNESLNSGDSDSSDDI